VLNQKIVDDYEQFSRSNYPHFVNSLYAEEYSNEAMQQAAKEKL